MSKTVLVLPENHPRNPKRIETSDPTEITQLISEGYKPLSDEDLAAEKAAADKAAEDLAAEKAAADKAAAEKNTGSELGNAGEKADKPGTRGGAR